MTPVAPLILRGEEWRHRRDPDAGMKDGGLWVRRVNHVSKSVRIAARLAISPNVQYYGANSPHPQDRHEAELMMEYIDRLADAIGEAMWPMAYTCVWCKVDVTEAHHRYHPICLKCFIQYPERYAQVDFGRDPGWPVDSPGTRTNRRMT